MKSSKQKYFMEEEFHNETPQPQYDYYYLLELVLKKNELIKDTIQHISNTSEVQKKCGILISSVLEQLDIIITQVRASLSYRTFASTREQKTEQHNYIIEFYDNKVSHLQQQNEMLYQQNKKLELRNESMNGQLCNFQKELKELRFELLSKEKNLIHFKNLGNEEQDYLRQTIATLQYRLQQKESEKEDILKEIKMMKESRLVLEKEFKIEKSNFSLKILQVNKLLDQSKAEFMRLVEELQKDNQILHKQNKNLEIKWITGEAERMHNQRDFSDQSRIFNQEIRKLKQELKQYQKSIQRKQKQNKDLLNKKEEIHKELIEFNEKIRAINSDTEWKLAKKVEEIELLEYENKKLHELVDMKTNELNEKQRVISVSRMRVEQLDKDKKILIDECDYKKNEITQLLKKIEILNRIIQEQTKEKEQSRNLLKQTYSKLSEYEVLFDTSKEKNNKEAVKHRQQKQNIKKEYELEIIELVNINKDLQSMNLSLERQISEYNIVRESTQEQVKEYENRLHAHKQKIEELRKDLNMAQLKLKQEKNLSNLQQEEMIQLKAHQKESDKKITELLKVNQELMLAREDLARYKDRYIQSENELKNYTDKKQMQISELKDRLNEEKSKIEQKYRKANQNTSLKSIEIVTLSSRNKNLEEELSNLKKSTTQEKNRLELRIQELEKLLRQRKQFQIKMQNLQYT